MKSTVTKKLLRWYCSRKRSLPWRDHPQPYAVWVGEIMAQQTRLDTMLPYYRRWMKRFPTTRKLAIADEQEVLAVWEGLGYYSRARNLHRASRQLVAVNGGRLPSSPDELRKLPGIGRYTAGAIASLAFGADAPAVDGNAVRVLARLFDVRQPVASSVGRERLWALAAENLPPGRAAEYNQALMDLGAQLCTPSNPDCPACPVKLECRAYALGIQEQRPVRGAARPMPLKHLAAAAIVRRGKALVLQRPEKGLLGGLWEFPNMEVKAPRNAKAKLVNLDLELPLSGGEFLGEFTHAYSHFRVQLQAFVFQANGPGGLQTSQKHKWCYITRLGDLPMGKLDRSIAKALQDIVR